MFSNLNSLEYITILSIIFIKEKFEKFHKNNLLNNLIIPFLLFIFNKVSKSLVLC